MPLSGAFQRLALRHNGKELEAKYRFRGVLPSAVRDSITQDEMGTSLLSERDHQAIPPADPAMALRNALNPHKSVVCTACGFARLVLNGITLCQCQPVYTVTYQGPERRIAEPFFDRELRRLARPVLFPPAHLRRLMA